MIRKYTPKKYESVNVMCDYLKLPFWNIEISYMDKNSIPFIYGITEKGVDFVMLGNNGGRHDDTICKNIKKLVSYGLSINRSDYLCGRIWFIHSADEEIPFGLITLWDNEAPKGYSDGKHIQIIKDLLMDKKINVSEFEIITQTKKINDLSVYTIPIEDYIRLRLNKTKDIPLAYEMQQKKRQRGSSYKREWDAFDYKDQGVGSLGYHLTAYMDENKNKKNKYKMSKKLINESKLAQLVYECTMEYINSTPELKKKLQEKKKKNKKALMESKQKSQGITYNMLFEMVKRTVKTLLK